MSRCFSKLITKNIRFLKDREYLGYLKRWNVKVSPHSAAMMHSGILGDETPSVGSSQEMYDSHFHGLHDFCTLIGDYNSLIILDPSVKKNAISMDVRSIKLYMKFKFLKKGQVLFDGNKVQVFDVCGSPIYCSGDINDPGRLDHF